jgi:transposase-like protein
MRFLVGLAVVAALAFAFIVLGVDSEAPVTHCPSCANKSIVMTQTSIGGPSYYSCTVCGTNFRRSSDGGPLTRV